MCSILEEIRRQSTQNLWNKISVDTLTFEASWMMEKLHRFLNRKLTLSAALRMLWKLCYSGKKCIVIEKPAETLRQAYG